MKKTVFSASAFAVAAVSAVAVMPTTSEAIPAFARQTGSACLACHFQSFPAINAYGRDFKKASFTSVGEQALIEDDHLSIPASLNATVVLRPQVTLTSTTGAASTRTIGYGDQVVLIAGRVGEHIGGFVELGGGAFGNHQIMTNTNVGDLQVGWSYYNSGFGENAGLALQNTWGQHGGVIGGSAVSANQRMLGTAGKQVQGTSLWISNDMLTVQAGLVTPTTPLGLTAPTAAAPTLSLAKMVRADAFFDLAGMEAGVGLMNISGTVGTTAFAANRTGLDLQLQGDMGDTQLGIYADYSTAKAGSATVANMYNADTLNARNAYSLRATVKPTHNVILMAGVGSDKSGNAKNALSIIGLEYEIYQNAVVAVSYTSDKATNGGAGTVGGAAGTVTTNTTLVDIEFLM
ncbi:MAG: hypothetical protein HQM07_06405 [Zetaproteobacteria bacterium]|nr:hypothetical protein [Zetaproteobacteria bacterium]